MDELQHKDNLNIDGCLVQKAYSGKYLNAEKRASQMCGKEITLYLASPSSINSYGTYNKALSYYRYPSSVNIVVPQDTEKLNLSEDELTVLAASEYFFASRRGKFETPKSGLLPGIAWQISGTDLLRYCVFGGLLLLAAVYASPKKSGDIFGLLFIWLTAGIIYLYFLSARNMNLAEVSYADKDAARLAGGAGSLTDALRKISNAVEGNGILAKRIEYLEGKSGGGQDDITPETGLRDKTGTGACMPEESKLPVYDILKDTCRPGISNEFPEAKMPSYDTLKETCRPETAYSGTPELYGASIYSSSNGGSKKLLVLIIVIFLIFLGIIFRAKIISSGGYMDGFKSFLSKENAASSEGKPAQAEAVMALSAAAQASPLNNNGKKASKGILARIIDIAAPR